MFTPRSQLRCSDDHRWLHDALAQRGLKAYLPSISVTDPKNRKPANEVSDWCKNEGFKLWSTTDNKYVASLDISGRRLQSVPTGRVA